MRSQTYKRNYVSINLLKPPSFTGLNLKLYFECISVENINVETVANFQHKGK